MRGKCLICNNLGKDVVLNKLPMFVCGSCGFVWRRSLDTDINYYKNKSIDLSKQKVLDRVENCIDRVKLFRRYIDLDYLCDIGCGEGVFLKVLNDFGYKGAIGVEPNNQVSGFAKKYNLNIINGTIDDICSVKDNNNIKVFSMLHLIEHLHNPRKSLEEVFFNMNKGDFLIIETPNIDAYSFKKLKYKHKLIYPEHLYYFNKKNIRMFLEDIGFKVLVSGKRDFNQNNFSISKSLFLLGFTFGKNKDFLNKKDIKNNFENTTNKVNESLIRIILRSFLNKLVLLLGRQDYLWIIAKK